MHPMLIILTAGVCFTLGFSLGVPNASTGDLRIGNAPQKAPAVNQSVRSPQNVPKEPGLPPSTHGPVGLDALARKSFKKGSARQSIPTQ